MVIIIVLNLIFGVIIDTFADLRSEKQKKEEILKTTCFICGERAPALPGALPLALAAPPHLPSPGPGVRLWDRSSLEMDVSPGLLPLAVQASSAPRRDPADGLSAGGDGLCVSRAPSWSERLGESTPGF